jgi:hypothetical protein
MKILIAIVFLLVSAVANASEIRDSFEGFSLEKVQLKIVARASAEHFLPLERIELNDRVVIEAVIVWLKTLRVHDTKIKVSPKIPASAEFRILLEFTNSRKQNLTVSLDGRREVIVKGRLYSWHSDGEFEVLSKLLKGGTINSKQREIIYQKFHSSTKYPKPPSEIKIPGL